MIPRYSRPGMVRIWEPENRFRIWFEIEAHACDAQAKLGVIPEGALQQGGLEGEGCGVRHQPASTRSSAR